MPKGKGKRTKSRARYKLNTNYRVRASCNNVRLIFPWKELMIESQAGEDPQTAESGLDTSPTQNTELEQIATRRF